MQPGWGRECGWASRSAPLNVGLFAGRAAGLRLLRAILGANNVFAGLNHDLDALRTAGGLGLGWKPAGPLFPAHLLFPASLGLCLRGAPRLCPLPLGSPQWGPRPPLFLGYHSISPLVPPFHFCPSSPSFHFQYPSGRRQGYIQTEVRSRLSAPQDPAVAPISPNPARPPLDWAPVTSDLNVLSSAPHLPSSRHTGLLAALSTHQARACSGLCPCTTLCLVTQLHLFLPRSLLGVIASARPCPAHQRPLSNFRFLHRTYPISHDFVFIVDLSLLGCKLYEGGSFAHGCVSSANSVWYTAGVPNMSVE